MTDKGPTAGIVNAHYQNLNTRKGAETKSLGFRLNTHGGSYSFQTK